MRRKKPKFKKGDLILDTEFPELFCVSTVVLVDYYHYHLLRTVNNYYDGQYSELIIIENRKIVEKEFIKIHDLEQCEILYK